jgi:hypothetical protein
MPTDIRDLRNTIIPRSDQLNSEQLLGGPLIITVTDVRAGSGEDQPVSIFHDTDPARPFKPCKTMRKVLILAWGPDGTQWIGRSMELYCDQAVKFGGEEVGGIRISRLTDIPKGIKVSLTATKGRKALHEIGLLKLSNALQEVLADIAAAEGKAGLERAKAKARELKSPADVELALAAYKKRVEALKEQAQAAKPADTPPPHQEPAGATNATPARPRYSTFADAVLKAPDRDAAKLAIAEAHAAGIPDDQLKDLGKLADERWPGA